MFPYNVDRENKESIPGRGHCLFTGSPHVCGIPPTSQRCAGEVNGVSKLSQSD